MDYAYGSEMQQSGPDRDRTGPTVSSRSDPLLFTCGLDRSEFVTNNLDRFISLECTYNDQIDLILRLSNNNLYKHEPSIIITTWSIPRG